MKVTIIATDNIGREESISFILDENSRTLKKLKKASDEGCLREELNNMEEETYRSLYSNYSYPYLHPYFSLHQLQRLYNFNFLIRHKFYNYKLSLQIR